MERRFYYSRSIIYGWCVYDRKTHTPAFEACADYLPPVKDMGIYGKTCVDPTNLTEYQAMRLCLKLNAAERKNANGLV